VTWIDAATLLPLRASSTRRRASSSRRDLRSVSRIDGVPTPLETKITTAGGNSSTTLS